MASPIKLQNLLPPLNMGSPCDLLWPVGYSQSCANRRLKNVCTLWLAFFSCAGKAVAMSTSWTLLILEDEGQCGKRPSCPRLAHSGHPPPEDHPRLSSIQWAHPNQNCPVDPESWSTKCLFSSFQFLLRVAYYEVKLNWCRNGYQKWSVRLLEQNSKHVVMALESDSKWRLRKQLRHC